MAFKPSAGKKHRSAEGGLSLTSLMDAMTIILLFLLNQFSADGALVTEAEGMKLPESLNTDKPKQATTVVVTKDHITVNNIEVALGAEYNGPVTSGYAIQSLYNHLDAKASELLDMDASLFEGDILVQGDRGLDYITFMRVVYSASQAGFTKIRLVAVQGN